MGDLETLLLAAIRDLGENAYGVTIRDRVEVATGRSVSFGRIYVTLDEMEKKGLVTSWSGDPTPERGWRPKRFYKLKEAG
jgi:PadR family transcriptional regulator, regulatory protein PadR